MADWPEPGTKAPAFTLPAHDGSKLSLSSLRGRPVVLYFYPKDDTPGCTVEACGFRDAARDLDAIDAVVLGISPDTPESHAAFRAKHRLPFTLLSDPDHAVADDYGAWRMKTLYGRRFAGLVRSTFLIDATGRITRVFKSVRPATHAAQVLAALADA
ncbi:MAG: thioredoxin-dependent thiol peroxidase [Planctomycetaceae bacterium]